VLDGLKNLRDRYFSDRSARIIRRSTAALACNGNEPGSANGKYCDHDDAPEAPVQGLIEDHADVRVAGKPTKPGRLVEKVMQPGGKFAAAILPDPDIQDGAESCCSERIAEAARKDDRSGGAAAHRPSTLFCTSVIPVVLMRPIPKPVRNDPTPQLRDGCPVSGITRERAERKDEAARPHRAADAERPEKSARQHYREWPADDEHGQGKPAAIGERPSTTRRAAPLQMSPPALHRSLLR
jgi:hypothetical protein